jgi:hypothetical protein
MMNRRHLLILLLFLFTAGLLGAQTPPPDAPKPQSPKQTQKDTPAPSQNVVQGYVTVGGMGMENADYRGRISEYTTANQGGRGGVGLGLWGFSGKVFYDLLASVQGDQRDQKHSFLLDARRYFRTEIRYTSLPHRLDHDPLDGLDAGKGAIIVRHDDVNAGDLYAIMRGELEVSSKFLIPRLPGVQLRVGYRDERRIGHAQARTISKCSNCHITAVSREVNQFTRDVTAGATVRIKRVSVDYAYLNRDFRERAPTPTLTYDDPVQPATLARIFDNRIQFGLSSGPQPFNQIPELRRESHTIRARLELPRDAALNLGFVKALAENEDVGLGTDSKVWSARLSVPVTRRLFLTARFRQMQVESEGIFINVVEPAAVAGPQLGRTYAQAYPSFGTADFMRNSAESRRPTTAEFEASFLAARRTTLRFGYTWEQIRRDHAAEFDMPYDSQRNTFTFSLNSRSNDRKWTLRTRYTFESTDDPFALLRAAYTPAIQPTPSPGTPPSPLLGTQYYTLYRARQANLSNQPSRTHWGEQTVTWTPTSHFSLNAHLRVRSMANDQLNMSDWNQLAITPGTEAWFAPHPRFSLMAGYYYHRERGDTWLVVPVFDG